MVVMSLGVGPEVGALEGIHILRVAHVGATKVKAGVPEDRRLPIQGQWNVVRRSQASRVRNRGIKGGGARRGGNDAGAVNARADQIRCNYNGNNLGRDPSNLG